MLSSVTIVVVRAVNLIIAMHNHSAVDVAVALESLLVNSIRSQDSRKFVRGIRRVNEGKCASEK